MGGGIPSVANLPDVINYNTVNAGVSTTITVTQKPRLLIYLRARVSNTNGHFAAIFYNIKDSKKYFVNYDASGFHEPKLADYTLPTDQLTSVSASSVVVKNDASYQIRQYVLIWY